MLGRQPTQTLATTPAKATPADAATMPVDETHHSKDVMHSNPAKRDSNVLSLDSKKVKIHGAALKHDPKPHKNSVEQNNIKNLKFSIDAILSKNDDKKLLYQVLDHKEQVASQAENQDIMQDLQLPTTSMDSNTE